MAKCGHHTGWTLENVSLFRCWPGTKVVLLVLRIPFHVNPNGSFLGSLYLPLTIVEPDPGNHPRIDLAAKRRGHLYERQRTDLYPVSPTSWVFDVGH